MQRTGKPIQNHTKGNEGIIHLASGIYQVSVCTRSWRQDIMGSLGKSEQTFGVDMHESALLQSHLYDRMNIGALAVMMCDR